MTNPARSDARLMLATVAVLALALIYALVGITPVMYFDVDPRLEPADVPFITFGPAGLMVLNMVSVIGAAAAMAAHTAAGGKVRWGSTILIAMGCTACVLHFNEHVESLWRCSHWFAAACLALAALHLAEHERPRRLMAAAMIALLVPLLIAALRYIWVDHPETVRRYFLERDEFLQARGWAFGSPQHELYERRLSFNDVTGSFALSNVYGSITAAWTVLACGLLAGQITARRWERAALAMLLVVIGLICVYLSKSKGAAAAAIVGLGVVTLACLRVPLLAYSRRRWLPVLAIALVLAAAGAVVVRGSAGPPDTVEGERSLFFRWQYWQAAARMIADAKPLDVLKGVGPGPFREMYLRDKEPLNPEDVLSTHSVMVDQTVMLGAGGIAWTLLMLGWLWNAAGAAARDEQLPTQTSPAWEIDRRDMEWAIVLAAVLFGAQLFFLWPVLLEPEMMLIWLLGVGVFLGLTALLLRDAWLPARFVRLGLFGAAIVLLIHGQIEMTFYHQGSVVIAWVMLAVAAARDVRPHNDDKATSAWFLSIAMLLAALVLATPTVTMWRQQQAMKKAAAALVSSGPQAALPRLDEGIKILPTDPRLYRWQAALRTELAYSDGASARRELDEALARLESAAEAGLTDVSLLRERARLQDQAAGLLNEPQRRAEAARLMREVLARHLYSLQDHLEAADLFLRLGEHGEAHQLYQRCMILSDQSYLDPARQLTVEQRAFVEQRLKDSAGGGR